MVILVVAQLQCDQIWRFLKVLGNKFTFNDCQQYSTDENHEKRLIMARFLTKKKKHFLK